MSEEEKPKKRRGRPRRDGSKSGNQREEIAAAAIQLFSRQGYAQTTLSEIARAAGLDQSSIYYWFSGKDDILRHLVELNRSSLCVASLVGSLPYDKPAQLYTVLHEDTLMLCNLPFDFYVLEEAGRDQPDSFKRLFDDIEALRVQVAGIIEEGIDEGSFISCDAAAQAALALAMDEGAQHRFHRANMTAGEGFTLSAHEVADASASATVARLLAHGDIASVRNRAFERDWIRS